MQANNTNTNDTAVCFPLSKGSINSAFIEELITLESMQDNMNYIGEILKNYIAGDYGFSVKITINGKDIKDESCQKLLKNYKYINNEKIKQKIKEYAEANKNDNLKIILVSLSIFLSMLFQASQIHYQHNSPQEKRDYSKEKGLGKLKKFLPKKSTLAFSGYAVLITIPFSMITSKDIGELTIDVGGGLLATLIGSTVAARFGKGWGKLAAPIFGAGVGAFLWGFRNDIQNIITWVNEQQIIEIDLEAILENILEFTTQNLISQNPFDIALEIIYQVLSIQEPKLKELISKEFQILANETSQENITGNLTNEEFQSLVVLLCDKKCNVNDVHSFLECSHYLSKQDSAKKESSHQLSSFSPVLFLNTINSHREGTICFSIKALDEYTRIPIKNAKIQLQNVNLGQESITNTKGLAFFEIVSKEYLKPFRVKLIHKDYETIPICNRRIIPNAIRSREKENLNG